MEAQVPFAVHQIERNAMNRHSIPLGRIFGIPIALDYSWFVIFALLTWMLAGATTPGIQELAAAPVLGDGRSNGHHALCQRAAPRTRTLRDRAVVQDSGAKHYPVPVRWGRSNRRGTAKRYRRVFHRCRRPARQPRPGDPLPCIAAFGRRIEPLLGLAKYLAYINLALVLFNLIPGYPLDGGRVLRAIVWAITGNMRRSTLIAANVGRFFAFLLIFTGVWQMFNGNFGGGLWIAFIGWFLDNAASVQIGQVVFQGLLTGHPVSQAMSTQYAIIPEDLTLQKLVDERILETAQRNFLVERGDKTVGLVTLHRIKEVPRGQWANTRAAQIMLPLEQLKCVDPNTELSSALEMMDRNGFNQMPVVLDRHIVGMLSREDVITFLRTLLEFGASPAQQPKPSR